VLPSLSERQEDIPTLVQHFLSHSELRHKKFSKPALDKLCQYHFPGNIRELRSIVEQSALMANEDTIYIDDLPPALNSAMATKTSQKQSVLSLEQAEKEYLSKLCISQEMSIEELAAQLDVSTRTLYRKFQKHGLRYEY